MSKLPPIPTIGDVLDTKTRDQVHALFRLQQTLKRELAKIDALPAKPRTPPSPARQRALEAAMPIRGGEYPGQPDRPVVDTSAAGQNAPRRGTGKARYWQMLGPPPVCGPGDTATAMIFYRKILSALERGGWRHSDRSSLAKLARLWRPRALGTDARFMIVGTRGGRLPRIVEARIAAMQEKQP